MMAHPLLHRAALPVLLMGVFLVKGTESVALPREPQNNDRKADVRDTLDGPFLGLQRTGALNCTLPFQDIGGRCLFIDSVTEGTWYELKTLCSSLGGQLAKVDSGDLVYDIVQFITQNGLFQHHYWLGGSDLETEGRFLWLDGTEVKMGAPFWGYDPSDKMQLPNGGTGQNCVFMDYYFYHGFNDIGCDFIANFICEQT